MSGDWADAATAAELLGVSVSVVYRLIRRAPLGAVSIAPRSRRYLVDLHWLRGQI